VLEENSKYLGDVIIQLQPFIESHTKPMENLIAGLRTEMASIKGSVGIKDLSRKDIPPCIWNAVETGFDSFLSLDEKVEKIETIASEAHELAGALLSAEESVHNQNQTIKSEQQQAAKSKVKTNDSNANSFFENLSKTCTVDGKIHCPITNPKDNDNSTNGNNNNNGNGGNSNSNPGGGGFGSDPSFPHPDNSNCDDNDLLCNHCMIKSHDLDSRLVSTNVRLSNLEDAKNGNVDSVILLKNCIYQGRSDIAAKLNKWFPEESNKKIDAGLFPTPHLILNLVHVDICSRTSSSTPLLERDLLRSGLRRSDADAYYTLKSDKPFFMADKDPCPNFSYSVTEAQQKVATIKFLPSYQDFGNGLDSNSLYHKFKTSLSHVKSESGRYIKSILSDHPDHQVLISISKQLLDDSCKFVSQMLGFMEELYSTCHDSFGATNEAWDLVRHCVEEIFTNKFKTCLKCSVAQDLIDIRNTVIGVIHSAFSLNCKFRELISIGLENHHSTTTSHVRFVMKMSSKSTIEKLVLDLKVKATISILEKENSNLKAMLKRLESCLDSFKAQVKNHLNIHDDDFGKIKRSKPGTKTKPGSTNNSDSEK
jgi:hypothetical protein